MTRNELVEMIRQEIQSLAFETLKDSAQKKKDARSRTFKPKGLSEEEIEYTLFYGGEKPKDDNIHNLISTTIKEGYENGLPKIQASEVVQFEDSLEEVMKDVDGAAVTFDKQKNGHSLSFWIGGDGIEGGASGKIDMGNKGSVEWAYSLKDGLTINTEDMSLEKGNKLVFEKLYNHYDSWQKDWREKLTITPGQDTGEEPAAAGAEAGPAEPGGEVGAPAGDLGGMPGEEAGVPPA